MAIPEKLKDLVDQMPDPDRRGMYCENVDKEKIEGAIAGIAQGGREFILGLIDMLSELGPGDDCKPRYALHCLGNHFLVAKDEQGRRTFGETLASQLGGDRPKGVQAFLCQELQWAGRAEAVTGLGKLLCDEELSAPAAMALEAIGDGAAGPLRAALPNAEGRCRLNVVQALGAIGDTQSIPALRAALQDEDCEVRLAAGWGLARMGDAGSADLLIKAAGAEPGWERIQAAKHCLVLAERLAAADKKAEANKVFRALRDSRTDPSERHVREAAERGMALAST